MEWLTTIQWTARGDILLSVLDLLPDLIHIVTDYVNDTHSLELLQRSLSLNRDHHLQLWQKGSILRMLPTGQIQLMVWLADGRPKQLRVYILHIKTDVATFWNAICDEFYLRALSPYCQWIKEIHEALRKWAYPICNQ